MSNPTFNAKLGSSTTCRQVFEAIEPVDGNLISELKGFTTIVTGANSGIGLKTAQHLSYIGSHVVLACRNAEKAEAAIEKIRSSDECSQYGVSPSDLKLSIAKLDLGSLASVKEFTTEIAGKVKAGDLPKIRLLVFNAGIFAYEPNKKSNDGLLVSFAVNHLGHFSLMRNLLNDSPTDLFAPNGVRVVNVSSMAHYGSYSTDKFTSEEELKHFVLGVATKEKRKKPKLGLMGPYGNSKICNVQFAKSLNELKHPSGVKISACSLHPGGVATEIGKDMGKGNFLLGLVIKIFSYFAKTPDQGAATSMICSLMPDDLLVGGGYYDDCKEKEPSKNTLGEEGRKGREVLWKLSEELCVAFEQDKLEDLLPVWDA